MSGTQDSVRRAEHSISRPDIPDSYSTNGLLFSNIEIESSESKLEGIEYPFEGQEIVKGDYRYEYEDQLGMDVAEGSFEIRTDSDLFVLRKASGAASVDNLVEELDSGLPGALTSEVTIHDKIRVNVDRIWEFIDKARDGSDLELISRNGDTVSYNSLLETGEEREEIVGEYPVAEANLIFYTPENNQVSVKYDRGDIQISLNEETGYEYIIQLFESVVLKK